MGIWVRREIENERVSKVCRLGFGLWIRVAVSMRDGSVEVVNITWIVVVKRREDDQRNLWSGR